LDAEREKNDNGTKIFAQNVADAHRTKRFENKPAFDQNKGGRVGSFRFNGNPPEAVEKYRRSQHRPNPSPFLNSLNDVFVVSPSRIDRRKAAEGGLVRIFAN